MAFETLTPLISYPADGVQTTFAIPDKFYDASDVKLFYINSAGIEGQFDFGTDYSVVITATDPTPPARKSGNVVLVTPPVTGGSVVVFIWPDSDQDQPFEGQPVTPRQNERVHDRHAMRDAALRELLFRGFRAPLDAPPALRYIEVGAAGRVPVYANDGSGSLVEGPTVGEVALVSEIVPQIIAVAAIDAQVVTVAGISAYVVVVSGISAEVQAVAAVAGAVAALAPYDDELVALAPVATQIGVLGNMSAELLALYAIRVAVSAVAANSVNINAVAGNAANITAVAGNATNINAVNANKTNIDTVAGAAANVNLVAGSIANVNTTAGAIANVNAVGGNIANVNAVAGNATNINAVAGSLPIIVDTAAVLAAVVRKDIDQNAAAYATAMKLNILRNTLQAWEVVGESSGSNVAWLDVLSTEMALCRALRITAHGTPTIAANLDFRFSFDDGASWEAGASEYVNNKAAWANGAASYGQAVTSSVNCLSLEPAHPARIAHVVCEVFQGVVAAASSKQPAFLTRSAHIGSGSGAAIATMVQGNMNTRVTPVTGVRFGMIGANTYGKVIVEGLRR